MYPLHFLMDSRRNPVIDALKYRVFHVPGADHAIKLRLFYKTRNEKHCFRGVFGGIGSGSGGYPHRRGNPGRRIGAGLVPKISASWKKGFIRREGCSRWELQRYCDAKTGEKRETFEDRGTEETRKRGKNRHSRGKNRCTVTLL